MLGFYDYTVIITYLSAVSALLGIRFAASCDFKLAIICLLVSGFCDMSDGAIASTKKNRTSRERAFGVQIDSLCDCISFGVCPPFIVYYLVKSLVPENIVLHYVALVIGIAFALCAIIRLAFFNVMEEERQKTEAGKRRTSYRGLPVTNIAFILPIAFLASYFLGGLALAIFLMSILAIVGFLFILDFKMIKLHGRQLVYVGFLGIAVIVAILLM